ncbi:T9SS type A sorting domain-containing protein [Bizionia sp. M204]|uniref:T9SS type A sorting domain-containing protein n=1 Tax=Bizionia sp. M204 TaxID=2675331 RepID=UPI002069AAAD|nr:T9SS type A sorting domain-containing protein [Bizionia sp. M204]UPS91814.1 T9SS type A sorting domain-containing protein [Bizionia sp. M204]
MKHIYFFIFIFINISTYAQQHQIQIELVDENVGYSLTVGGQYSNESNDAGLNLIFQNHNVTSYEMVYGYTNETMMDKLGVVSCEDCDVEQFLQDLTNYNSVINYVDIFSGDVLSNGLVLNLVDNNVGSFVSYSNEIAVTNDGGLNQIFSDYNVRLYENVNVGTSYEQYELVCNCDANLLKQELDSYSTVVSITDYVYASFLLLTADIESQGVKIYPNPFTNTINLDTVTPIKTIEVYNILGKRVHVSSKTRNFEYFAPTLTRGIYLLKIINQNGQTSTKKLIKN